MIKITDLYQISIHALLVGLAIMVVTLGHQNRKLREPSPPPESAQLAEGEKFGPVAVRDLEGDPLRLSFMGSAKESLVLVFTTTCAACQQNQERWRSISETLGERYDIIGLSLDDVEKTVSYKERNRLPFRTLVADDARDFALSNKVYQVP